MEIVDNRNKKQLVKGFEDHDVVEATDDFGKKILLMIACVSGPNKYMFVPLEDCQKNCSWGNFKGDAYSSPDELVKGVLADSDFGITSIMKVKAKLIIEDHKENSNECTDD